MALPPLVKRAAPVVAFVVLGMLFLFCLLAYVVRNKPVPKERKLADISDETLRTVVAWPKAAPWSCQMVLGLQPDDGHVVVTRQCPEFNASVRIFHDEVAIAEFSISSRDATPCNWLSHEGNLNGFILTWHRTNLFVNLAPRTLYQVAVTFDRHVPQGSSLWLCYLQSLGERD